MKILHDAGAYSVVVLPGEEPVLLIGKDYSKELLQLLQRSAKNIRRLDLQPDNKELVVLLRGIRRMLEDVSDFSVLFQNEKSRDLEVVFAGRDLHNAARNLREIERNREEDDDNCCN